MIALGDGLLCDVKLSCPLLQLLLQRLDLSLHLRAHLLRTALQALPFPPQLFDQIVNLGLHFRAHSLKLLAHSFRLLLELCLIFSDEFRFLRLKIILHLAFLSFMLLRHLLHLSLMRLHQLLDLRLQLRDEVATFILQHVYLIFELLYSLFVVFLHAVRLVYLGLLLSLYGFNLSLEILFIELQPFYLVI